MSIKEYAQKMIAADQVFKDIADQKETLWVNSKLLPFDMVDAVCQLVVSDEDIADAEARLQRFAPYIKKCFPETEADNGLIESPLAEISAMKDALAEKYDAEIPGRLLLKMDSHLPIAGSVKARGGIYEVLKHAEDLALEAGMITEDDNYERFADDDFKKFFGQYTVQVGSTGNLGLSIGIMSAFLGFKVKVHMSADARQWKKDMLRSKGVDVIEYEDDYSKAVMEGRRLSDMDPSSYFVDDEYSLPLFLGYAVAAKRMIPQFEALNVTVDEDHPLIVYIPCGVGGAPGGVCYGLKRLYGDNVHVFFCEPTLFPSMLIGMASDRYNDSNVSDFGLTGMSAADGLACASPSGLVARLCRNLLAGDFTVRDAILFDYMRMLKETEDIFIEPSSCAAFTAPVNFLKYEAGREYLEKQGFDADKLANCTQVCWATGGRLVPDEIWDKYMNTYME
ncbi:MAG: D-serine ammonia-lyase [Mogibacterium sp.]|nr:D-serine ammonia-lyase [Mogibacterium sp.]